MGKTPDRGPLLVRLREIRTQLGQIQALYAERLELFRAARAMDPPVKIADLADAAGISDTGVIKELKRGEERRAAG